LADENRTLASVVQELQHEKHLWEAWEEAQNRTDVTAEKHNLNKVIVFEALSSRIVLDSKPTTLQQSDRTPMGDSALLREAEQRLDRTNFDSISSIDERSIDRVQRDVVPRSEKEKSAVEGELFESGRPARSAPEDRKRF